MNAKTVKNYLNSIISEELAQSKETTEAETPQWFKLAEKLWHELKYAESEVKPGLTGDNKKLIFPLLVALAKIMQANPNGKLQELNLDTYSDVMNKTSKFPDTRFFGKDDKKADKEANVNSLSRERFISEYYKKYAPDTIEINAEVDSTKNSVGYVFKSISFDTNYTSYALHFQYNGKQIGMDKLYTEKNFPKNIFITYNSGKPYIDEYNKHKLKISNTDIKNITEMLKFNEWKNIKKLTEDSKFTADGGFNPGNLSKATLTSTPGNSFYIALTKIRKASAEVMDEIRRGTLRVTPLESKIIGDIDHIIDLQQKKIKK